MQPMHFRYFSALAYGFLSEGHLRAGTLADGLVAVNAGLAVAASSLDRAYAPELWRLKGELLLREKTVESRQLRVERTGGPGPQRTMNSRLF